MLRSLTPGANLRRAGDVAAVPLRVADLGTALYVNPGTLPAVSLALEAVLETVEAVPRTVEAVLETVEAVSRTVEAVLETVEAVGSRFRSSAERLRKPHNPSTCEYIFFNLPAKASEALQNYESDFCPLQAVRKPLQA